uniref:Myb-like domain-containing protein n=1 Tax=Brassica oleracea var. oleracea TaxID=109376 RepID=A0A0D3CHK1_BRAOL
MHVDAAAKLKNNKHSVSLSLAPFRRNHRVSLSLLDDSACDFFICQQSDEGFSISIVGLVIYVGGLRPYLGGIVVSLSLLDDSASLSLSSTAHLDEESLHLSLHPVALLDEIKSKGKDGRIKRHEGSSKKRTVVWTDQETMAISGNEQRSVAFWKRIAAYYSASPKNVECDKREASHCKQRWHKINDLVCKFCGEYEAVTREKTSGQNENDVLKHSHKIFFNNHNKKFTLEHVWKELRND